MAWGKLWTDSIIRIKAGLNFLVSFQLWGHSLLVKPVSDILLKAARSGNHIRCHCNCASTSLGSTKHSYCFTWSFLAMLCTCTGIRRNIYVVNALSGFVGARCWSSYSYSLEDRGNRYASGKTLKNMDTWNNRNELKIWNKTVHKILGHISWDILYSQMLSNNVFLLQLCHYTWKSRYV